MKRKDLDDPELSLDKLMARWPNTVTVFMRHKMICVGCMVNPFHTVSDACLEYNLDEKLFRQELHKAIGG